jgi:putative nucleotidyltransferase with HDIG domain
VSPIQFADAAWLTKLGRNALAEVLNYGILDSEGRLAEGHASGASQITILRDRPAKGLKASQRLTLSEVPRMDDARERLRSRVLEMAKAHAEENPGQAIDWARLGNAAYELAKLNLSETMAFDGVATEAAREAARCAAAPVMKTIQRFEVIQRGGEPWTEQARSDVKMYWAKKRAEQGTAGGAPAAVVSHMIFVGLVLTALVRSVRVTSLEPYKPGFHLNLALLILCGTLVVGRVVSYFDPSGFTVPVAAGTILLAILTQVRVAVITSFAAAVLLSVQYGYNWRLLVVSLAMAMAGALSILKVRRRSDMTTASVRSAAVGIAAMAAVLLAAGSAFSEAGLRHLLLIGLNGAACLFIVPGMLSPLERLFGITTDIQLLEYSDLNNEILSRMAIEVPATYTHSLMVGQLAEVAADAIGANGLLARVCAYYHDIGKLRRPEYFSENQIGYNIHDSLSPRLSARAIASHALEGVEIARAHHLPTPIVDGILEHHGTCLVSFFHQQAAAQDRHGDVREEDFRYPGPKPQSRETAILMICDVVESGVRSIKHPNEERVREFVDKIILARGADRQFDESGLTLKELDAIKEAVTRRMLTALHTRIAYPEQPRNVIPISGGGGP